MPEEKPEAKPKKQPIKRATSKKLTPQAPPSPPVAADGAAEVTPAKAALRKRAPAAPKGSPTVAKKPAKKPPAKRASETVQVALPREARGASVAIDAQPATTVASTPAPGTPVATSPVGPVSASPAAASTAQSQPLALPTAAGLSVLMVASEAHPWAKTGGLAEVAASLTDALGALGHSVTLVLPRYRMIAIDDAERLQTRFRLGDRLQPVTFYRKRLSERVTLVLVDVPELFDRDGLYGTPDGDYPDNALRYAVFSRAALEYPRLIEWRPSIIHAHDWQSGLVPVYQKMHLSGDPHVGGVPAVFTIHNLAFQGVFPAATLPSIGLGYEVLDVQAMEFWGNISYLKGGINFSERITTVSPGYAKEIVRPELGFGFEGVLARRANDLVGILNGIDTSRWNPMTDEFVRTSFNADNIKGKQDAKRALLTAVGLPSDEAAQARPLIGLISRLTDQKGYDLITAAADRLMAPDATWVMLGSGERRYENVWTSLEARYPERVSTTIGFDERLAHHIEAGADMFLMPSRFEPCGLNQMYSLRYGTVPIVRATGGLNDTVVDVDASPSTGTGFKFSEYSADALVGAVTRALRTYQDRDRWLAIARSGMQQDHSWDGSAKAYVKVYVAMLNAE